MLKITKQPYIILFQGKKYKVENVSSPHEAYVFFESQMKESLKLPESFKVKIIRAGEKVEIKEEEYQEIPLVIRAAELEEFTNITDKNYERIKTSS